MKSAQWLDRTKEHLNIPSDYQLAKVLNISTQRVSNYRTGRQGMDDTLAIRIAELLEIPPGQILADLHAERATDSGVKKAWKTIARDYAAAVALIAIALPEKILHVPTLYIMLTSIINRISPGFCLYSRRTT